jgi:hypothetical protein
MKAKKLKPEHSGLSFFMSHGARSADCRTGADILANPASGAVPGKAE